MARKYVLCVKRMIVAIKFCLFWPLLYSTTALTDLNRPVERNYRLWILRQDCMVYKEMWWEGNYRTSFRSLSILRSLGRNGNCSLTFMAEWLEAEKILYSDTIFNKIMLWIIRVHWYKTHHHKKAYRINEVNSCRIVYLGTNCSRLLSCIF
jgi:hypothetical protein